MMRAKPVNKYEVGRDTNCHYFFTKGNAMPNGRPGDHPVHDIEVNGIEVYSPEIDALILRLVEKGHRIEVDQIVLGYGYHPDAIQLKAMVEELESIQASHEGDA
jgi:hypothetical protein